MERRQVLLNTLGVASAALLAWPRSPVKTDARAKRSPHLDNLMGEVRAAYCLGWSRIDFGYPIPHLDRAWAQLPGDVANSVRVVIVEQRNRLLELVRDAESSLLAHRETAERKPFDWEPRYWLAFTLKRVVH